jgi:hypothetical protein
MGNDPSKQTIENINSSISSNILKALQKSQINSSLQQQVTGKCDSQRIKDLSEGYTQCIVEFIDEKTPDDLLRDCSIFSEMCRMTDVDLKAIINVKSLTTQDASIIQEIKTNIANTLTQASGPDTDQLVSNINNNISRIVSEIVQELKSNNNISQIVDLDGIKGSYISMNTTLNTISKAVQKDEIISENVTKISNIISQTSINENSLLTTAIYIALMILIAGFLISIIMTLNRSNGIVDFFYKILPFIIFFVIIAIIIIVHVLANPAYITFKDKDGKVIINKQKFLMYMSIYCFVIGVIILIVNKIIKNNVIINGTP